jgi:hypothetical protein
MASSSSFQHLDVAPLTKHDHQRWEPVLLDKFSVSLLFPKDNVQCVPADVATRSFL